MAGIGAALAGLVERRIGFALVPDQIERKLLPLSAQRTAALSLASPWAYLELLESEPPSGAEWRHVIEVLTNGQTSFFRDPEQFAAIGRHLAARAPSGRPLWVWSAGCSTGEEAYSLAILCTELGLAGRTRIVASDINPEFLARAKEARFSAWAVRNVSPDRRSRWFDGAGDAFTARDEVRRLVELRRHNLVTDEPLRPPEGGWHAILCRNVFIYFRRERMAEACLRLAATVAPDGWLAIAASETLRGLGVPLAPEVAHGRVFYRPIPAVATVTAAARSAVPVPLPRATTGPLVLPGSALERVVQLARAGSVRGAIELLERDGDDSTLAHHLAHGHLRLRLHENRRRPGRLSVCSRHRFPPVRGPLLHRRGPPQGGQLAGGGRSAAPGAVSRPGLLAGGLPPGRRPRPARPRARGGAREGARPPPAERARTRCRLAVRPAVRGVVLCRRERRASGASNGALRDVS